MTTEQCPVDEYIIFGKGPLLEALKSGRGLNKILIAKGSQDSRIREILQGAKDRNLPYQFVDRRRLNALCEGNHQGVIGFAAFKPYVSVEEILEISTSAEKAPFILLLDGIQDPHNLGAILRTADEVGVDGAILPKHRSAGLSPAVAKASAGAVEYLAVARVTNLARTIETLKERGLWMVGVEADAPQNFSEVDYRGPVGIIVGGEDRGIRPLVRRQCDFLVRIPMRGHIGSLNASVASAILMYEVFRQRCLS